MDSHVRRVAVVGSGIVGRSWAIVFARAGCHVTLFDAIPTAAQDALPLIRKVCTCEVALCLIQIIFKLAADLLAAGLLGRCKTADEAMQNIAVASTLKEAVKDATWVQECVPEKVEMKMPVFTGVH